MKESLFDIFQRHRDCYDDRKSPTIEEQKANREARQLEIDRFRERKQAASEYASSLIPLGNDWIEAVKADVYGLTNTLPPSLHFNKAEREAYRDGVEAFLLDVKNALVSHGKGKFLNGDYFDPVTLYRFEIISMGWELPQTELTKDEAEQVYKDMKQRYSQVYCFPDLFSMFPATYTVLGYKPKASTPAQPQKKADSNATGTGMGNNATTPPQTPPAAQKTAKRRKTRKFKEYVKNQDNADLIVLAIHGVINEYTTPRDKAKVIVACTETWINKPTNPSVKEEFDISDSEFSTFKDCITFHYQPTNSRKPKKGFPFPDNELKVIREKIKENIDKLQAKKG